MNNEIVFTVLADGTIRTVTGSFSGAIHNNAEAFLRDVQSLAGGQTESKSNKAHAHDHVHDHVHVHEEDLA